MHHKSSQWSDIVRFWFFEFYFSKWTRVDFRNIIRLLVTNFRNVFSLLTRVLRVGDFYFLFCFTYSVGSARGLMQRPVLNLEWRQQYTASLHRVHRFNVSLDSHTAHFNSVIASFSIVDNGLPKLSSLKKSKLYERVVYLCTAVYCGWFLDSVFPIHAI